MHCCSAQSTTHMRITVPPSPSPGTVHSHWCLHKTKQGSAPFIKQTMSPSDSVARKMSPIGSHAMATFNQSYATQTTADIKSGLSEKRNCCCGPSKIFKYSIKQSSKYAVIRCKSLICLSQKKKQPWMLLLRKKSNKKSKSFRTFAQL